MYISERLVIPRHGNIRETLFLLAHDTLGHFGFKKSYGSLKDAYYWPNMRKDLENTYIPSCTSCQRNKSPTRKPIGPLHPTPIPDGRFKNLAIDFIGPLPKDNGFDQIITITDMLGTDYRLIPSKTNDTAEDFALRFFDGWYCEHGLPDNIFSDRDKLFVSQFWKALTRLTGIKLRMSTAYHPQTDSTSERTNKTINQAVHYHVSRNQLGWVRTLPRIRFHIMNTTNVSTGFSGFQLMTGHSPRIIPALTTLPASADLGEVTALNNMKSVLQTLEDDVQGARDNLLLSKITQASQKNKH